MYTLYRVCDFKISISKQRVNFSCHGRHSRAASSGGGDDDGGSGGYGGSGDGGDGGGGGSNSGGEHDAPSDSPSHIVSHQPVQLAFFRAAAAAALQILESCNQSRGITKCNLT